MMKKEKELLVAVASQKGGVGKSVFTVLLASVLHYRKGLRVAVVDCDYPQHSIALMRERDMGGPATRHAVDRQCSSYTSLRTHGGNTGKRLLETKLATRHGQ